MHKNYTKESKGTGNSNLDATANWITRALITLLRKLKQRYDNRAVMQPPRRQQRVGNMHCLRGNANPFVYFFPATQTLNLQLYNTSELQWLMVLAGKESKIQTSIEGQTNWEQIHAAKRSVQGSSPILEGQAVLVHSWLRECHQEQKERKKRNGSLPMEATFFWQSSNCESQTKFSNPIITSPGTI